MKRLLTPKQINAASAAVRGRHVLLPDEIEAIYMAIYRTSSKIKPPTREQLIDWAYACNKGGDTFDFLAFARLIQNHYESA